MDVEQAKRAIEDLRIDLQRIVEKDPEQEVQAPALQVVDAVLRAAKDQVPEGDPVLDAISDVIYPEVIDSGEPVRAVDLYLVCGQVLAALERAAPSEPLVG